MARIAERAGVAVGNLHYHFGSRDDLLRELQQWVLDELIGEMRDAIAESGDFLVTAPLSAPAPAATRQAPIVAAVLVAFVVLSAVGVLSIVEGALLAAGALIALRVVSFSDAKNSIDLDVLLLIASAFGLGVAVEGSGLAQDIADGFVDGLGGLGTFGVILGVVLATWADDTAPSGAMTNRMLTRPDRLGCLSSCCS